MRIKILHEHSAQIRAAYQLSSVRGKNLIKMFPQYSKAAIYKHAKTPLNGDPVFDKRKMNKGRPKKLTVQDERCILRTIPKLREELGNFTSKRVQLAFHTADIFASFGVLPLLHLRAYTLQDATVYTCSYLYSGNFIISTVKSRYSHCFNCLILFNENRQYPKNGRFWP